MAARGLDLLFVGPYPPRRGGTAASLLQLTVALAEAGHRVRMLAPITRETAGFDSAFAGGLGGVRLSRYPVPYFLYSHSSVPFDAHYRSSEEEAIREALPALIDEATPDVVVAGVEPLALCVPAVAREHGVPSVLLLRGGPTWKIVDGTYPQVEGREWLDAYRGADRVITVSRHFEEGLRRLGVEDVCTIRNHVDLARFAPRPKDERVLRELDLCAETVVIVHAAQLEPRKRSLDVLASARSVLADCPAAAYVVAGDGSQLQDLRTACERTGISDRFRFVGWVAYERMPSLLSAADLVVQPSDREGLARVYLEAMACGRVLVASDIPAAREIVRHGENGLLFETGNADALAAATLLAALDPALRLRLGREARRSVAPHSLDHVADEYATLFRDLAQAARGS